MDELVLVGIGTGSPDHLTRAAISALNGVDAVLLPRKGADKSDLAEVRRRICAEVIATPAVRIVEFDLPVRDAAMPDYLARVEDWHDRIAAIWEKALLKVPGAARVALLVWGDPSLYDSTLRIAGRLRPVPKITVVPGITAIQALTALHAIPLNDLGAPFLVTTGRRLRDEGWPSGIDTLVVMLDGECSFRSLDTPGARIWWGAYLGMPEEFGFSGVLAEIGPQIVAARAEARARHGWIMDIYLLRR